MKFDINKIVTQLSNVKGVISIALGGSHSRHEATDTSDYDIGLYFDKNEIDLSRLHEVLKNLDDNHEQNILSTPGTWGPWINGGSWLTVDNTPVDILLREVNKVKEVIDDCLHGIITIDYQCGHPFGFVNSIYAAETHYCIPLWQDSNNPLTALKDYLHSHGCYPPKMKLSIIKKFLWEARFSLDCGYKPALRGDFNYAIGSVFRAIYSWIEVLYATNEVYMMNEKGTVRQSDRLNFKPQDMELRIKEVYNAILSDKSPYGFELLDAIHDEIQTLAKII